VLLEQELHPLTQKKFSKKSVKKRIADKVIKVTLKDGKSLCAIVHIEIQGTEDRAFPSRVFTYRYRLYDKYESDIATLVVLIDNKYSYRPNIYDYEFWGTKLRLEYPIIKILDYQGNEESLKKSKNPFAVIVLAQLAAMKTSPGDKNRLVTKEELFRFLIIHGFERGKIESLARFLIIHGFERGKIESLARFLDGILALIPDLAVKYIQTVKEIEAEYNMSFITQTEQMWLDQGREQGVLTGEKKILEKQLKSKFNDLPERYRKRIAETNESDTLVHWGIQILKAKTIDEVFKQQG
jgi:hypothetical protein